MTKIVLQLSYIYLQDYQQIVDAEWDILYDKLEKLVKSGAQVILSKLPIGDVATQYFADRYSAVLLNIHIYWVCSILKDTTKARFFCPVRPPVMAV